MIKNIKNKYFTTNKIFSYFNEIYFIMNVNFKYNIYVYIY